MADSAYNTPSEYIGHHLTNNAIALSEHNMMVLHLDSAIMAMLLGFVSMGLICYPGGWNKEKDMPAIPERPTGRSQVRYVLIGNYFALTLGSPSVWFSNELIEGYGKFYKPWGFGYISCFIIYFDIVGYSIF